MFDPIEGRLSVISQDPTDGTEVAAGTAVDVVVSTGPGEGSTPTPTPTATATPTGTPIASATPTPTPTGSPTATATPTGTPVASATPTPTPTGSLTATPTPTSVPGAAKLDVDGNDELGALTDGLLAVRYLFGFTGPTLITGAVAPDCTRCDAPAITTYIQTLL